MTELKIGDKAPNFKVKNTEGKIRTLKDYAGKTLVLYFYPRDNTPGCTKEACSFRDNYKELRKKEIEIVGVSTDSEESHRKFIEKCKLPFELLADVNKEIVKKYGVYVMKNMFGKKYMGIKRTTFLIKEGIIKSIIKTVDVKNSANQILKHVEK